MLQFPNQECIEFPNQRNRCNCPTSREHAKLLYKKDHVVQQSQFLFHIANLSLTQTKQVSTVSISTSITSLDSDRRQQPIKMHFPRQVVVLAGFLGLVAAEPLLSQRADSEGKINYVGCTPQQISVLDTTAHAALTIAKEMTTEFSTSNPYVEAFWCATLFPSSPSPPSIVCPLHRPFCEKPHQTRPETKC